MTERMKLLAVALVAMFAGMFGAASFSGSSAEAAPPARVAQLSCGVHVDGHTTSSGNWSIHATYNPCNRAYRAWANFICYGNGFKEGVNRIGQAVKGHNYSYARPRCPSSLPNHVLNEGGFETYHDGAWHGPYCIVGCPVRAKDLSRGT